MPGFLLHLGAQVMCMHGGQATPTTPFPRVTVGGQPIVQQPNPYVIAGCALTGTPNPPCVTAQWVSAATRVTAGGMPVLLFDSQAVCVAPGTGLLITTTQIRTQGM